MSGKIKLGVNMFSFNTEFYSGKLSIDDCVRTAAEVGGTGIELIGAQMVPGYPYPTDKFIDHFRAVCAENNIQPVSYGAYVDNCIIKGYRQTEQETLRSTLEDVRIAVKLGASVLRTQQTIGPETLAKMAGMAEDYGVHIGVELHAPQDFSTPVMQEYFNVLERVGSPYIGIIPDFGIFMEHPDHAFYNGYQSMGANKEILDCAIDAFERGDSREAAQETVLAMGAKGIDAKLVDVIYDKYHPANLEGLRQFMPHIKYAHGKFYYVDENLNDPSIPMEKVLHIFDEADYDGYISSEYEGHFFGSPEMTGQDTIEQLRRHIQMEKRILGL